MSEKEVKWDLIEKLIGEMLQKQKDDLLDLGRRIVPTLTGDDLLQPNDYDELEHHPLFRYEEGVLAGIKCLQAALLALKKEN